MVIQNQINQTDKIVDSLFKELSRIDILQKYKIDISDINDLKEDSSFIRELSMMIKNNRFTAAQTLELYWNKFQSVDESISKKEWLKEIYHFCQFLSFPNTRLELKDISLSRKKLYYIFLLTYRQIISLSQRVMDKDSFLSKYPLNFLTSEEIDTLEQPSEYRRFLNASDELFVYEMMSLSKEIFGYATLDHICGVHALALSVARQIKKQGFSLDLGIVSGAAAGHDIGKYGCRKNEQKRVPYLHYYYTDIWFQEQNIPYIGHIAVNHSVWDLELENLSLEALILIYSDFRVKNKMNSDDMNIFSLEESFQVILNKLDNVDEQKKKRYSHVFAKLNDFENFLIAKGVNVNLIPLTEQAHFKRKRELFFALLHGDEVVKQIKYLSLEHSFKLMFQLRNESSINSIFESARSDGNWQNLQEYLRIFAEYASYLNQNEKILALKFLYEQLIFPEEGIRRRSAKLIGYLIATFDEKYRKEIPDDVNIEPSKVKSTELLDKYIRLFIEPTYKTSELNQCRIRENLPFIFDSLLENSQERQATEYLQIIRDYYLEYNNNKVPKCITIYLLQALKSIPILPGQFINQAFAEFLLRFIQHEENTLRLTALDVTDNILTKTSKDDPFWKNCQLILEKIGECSLIPAENYLRFKIIKKIKARKALVNRFQKYCLQDIEKIERMYLNNLKSSTDAIIKKVQIDMLVERAKTSREEAVYTALHFCNILKVSSHEPIRNYAGRALIEVIPYLNVEQKNDISIELLKALEIDDYQYTKYIPYYLGQSMPFLPPREIDEFIDDLEQKIKVADQWTCTLLIRTLAVAISRYAPYRTRYQEENNSFENRLARMLGILMNGLAHHDKLIKRVTSRVIGKEIFASTHLSLREKNDIFRLLAKKYLNLIAPLAQYDTLLFFTNSVALHQIYIFITDYYFYEGKINLQIPKSVAFFPGSFDPFSLSHKAIVREIEKIGMEVYLSVDEFSWSKRTQPHLYRKNLINMSIADELDVYLYPESLPSNIANPNDLKLLKKQFPKSEIYLVAGSDVLLNASAYNSIDTKDSIISFPHIVFTRKSFQLSEKQQKKYQEIISKITSGVIQLNLEAPFEEISSSQIRKNIDNHRDISDLVDPLAERYIYKFGLYQREPQYKSTLQKIYTRVEIRENIDNGLIERLVDEVFLENNRKRAFDSLKKFNKKLNPRIILFKDTQNGGKILGFSAIHWIRSSMFYHEFRDNAISQYIRDNATGRTIVIDGVFTVTSDENTSLFKDLRQIILTETLTFCVKKDYDYAVFKNMVPETNYPELMETLELFGFTELPVSKKNSTILSVDIRKPCTINLDVETLIKEPFAQSYRVIETIEKARKNLQRAITRLYPGHLLIPFNIDMINQSIVAKVCKENGVHIEQENNRDLGPLMCVPFGKILHKMVVPNTVTKSLHTDKVFTPDMQHFKIDSFGYYMSLENQVKMIKSFNRPVLLIDDLLHKGYRLRALSPLLRKENIKVHKIIVGLISGRGKELAMIQKRSVDGAYFVPNLRVWFNESDLYPFIGGDGLFRQESGQDNLVRSINMISPFAYPVFLKGVEHKIVYYLSKICIENAINIMYTLESEYQAIYHRKLTLGHLGEVCLYPRYPDRGKYMNYNMSIATSIYLENDLELLHRIWEGGEKASSKDLLLYPDSREFNLGKEVL
jgi:nicotinic acid mononucleotide adenylyltransferase/hypoxanthine-guanine phosphoribosyltransferase